jgi:4-hydroxybenzoate polyprenyltransferase
MSSPNPALSLARRRTASLGDWLALARISNTPTVVSNVAAGAALASALRLDWAVAMVAAAMVLFYTAGMVLNDLFDFDWDLRHRPDRPLASGAISRAAAASAGLGLLAGGAALLGLVGPRAFLSGLVLIVLIVFYDAWHKTNPLSPLVMALCRLLVYVTAFVAFGWPLSRDLLIAGGLLLAYVMGLTAIAKSESRPGLVGYWPAGLVLLPAVYFGARPQPLWLLPLALLFAVWVAHCLSFVYRTQGRDIGTAIARLIAGISLLDGLVVVASAGAAGGVVIPLAAFGLTLWLQRHVQGT